MDLSKGEKAVDKMNEKGWMHPTGGRPSSVIMLLLGQSKAEYANNLAVSHETSAFDRFDTEIWTCNAGFRIWQHDLLFVMDDLEGEAHKWPKYKRDLKYHDRPIITSAFYPGYGDLFEYPYQWVCKALGLNGHARYFQNTVPFMLAYAIALGVKNIEIFGADYWHPQTTAREAALPNAEYWLGYAIACGVNIGLPRSTTLMGGPNRFTYGYRFDPRVTMDRKDDADKKCTPNRPPRTLDTDARENVPVADASRESATG